MLTPVVLAVHLVAAADGLADLFPTRGVDLGAVPRGTVHVHRFVLKNTTAEVVRVGGLRSNCRCAIPRAIQRLARPGEELSIEVVCDTAPFVGERTMTIYVSFVEPRRETATLRLTAFSREDVIVNPGKVDFGVLAKNAPARERVTIEFLGKARRKVEVAPPAGGPGAAAIVALEPLAAPADRRAFAATIELRPQPRSGRVTDVVTLTTDDPQSPKIRVPVEALIRGAVEVSPATLDFGSTAVGERVERRLVLKADQPFTLVSIAGDADELRIDLPREPRRLHLLTVVFTPRSADRAEYELQLTSSIDGEPPVPIRAFADVDRARK